jgi:uncharacterized protein YdeI (YjbR/CyaY-like superfamily)
VKVEFFTYPAEFSQWLTDNHDKASELWLGFYKKQSGKTGMTYAEALDEALCFGWIDGIRNRVDEISYTSRFTPRRPNSNWSMVNTRRAEELIELGRMQPAGLKAFQERDRSKTGSYSFEEENRSLAAVYEAQFKTNSTAWNFFQAQPPGYRKTASWWVMSAKREETRLRRLARLIEDSERGVRLAVITSPAKRAK